MVKRRGLWQRESKSLHQKRLKKLSLQRYFPPLLDQDDGGGPLRSRHVTHNFMILMILIISGDDMTASPILFASSSTCRAPSTSYRTFHKLSRLILHHYACVDNSCDCLAQSFHPHGFCSYVSYVPQVGWAVGGFKQPAP